MTKTGITLACSQPDVSIFLFLSGSFLCVLPCLKMSAHLNNSFIFITNLKFTKSFNSYLCLKLQQESTQAACRQASRVEEVARERCRQMFEDLNSHCRIPVSSCCTLKLLNHLVAGRHTKADAWFLTCHLNPETEGNIRAVCRGKEGGAISQPQPEVTELLNVVSAC